MIGITAYSAYVPRYRLRRETIAAAWAAKALPGCKAVGNFDEDALTMAQAAAWKIVAGGSKVAALSFASTSAPYWQRSSASLIAAACDLRAATATADFAGSLRAGTTSLRAALDAVAAGSAASVLATAGDLRQAAPESAEEMLFGDAAAAVAVGTQDVIAEFVAAVSRSDDFPDEWRRDTDRHVRSFASKYSTTRGYGANLVAAARELLERAGVRPEQVARVALASPDGRAHFEVAKALTLPPDRLEDTRAADLGVTGAAMPLLLLAQALDRARTGDLLLVLAYGDGADALLFRATNNARPRLAPGGATLEYPTYPLYRKLHGFMRAASGGAEVSNILLRREEPQNLRLHGSACPRCGAISFPIARVCAACRHADGLVQKPLARTGKLFTFTRDFLYDSPVQPTVMAVVDLDGGGRFLCQMTDADPASVEIGMPVELVLRRMRESPADHHYYWKCRPAGDHAHA